MAKNKLVKILKTAFLSIIFILGVWFPNSGIIKKCDNDYESNDDVQMFI